MKSETISNPVSPAGSGFYRPRWMVVDDNEEILSLLVLFLSHAGEAAVYRFHSAEAALDAFRAAPARWDMVLTDLEMPGMDGIELGTRFLELRGDVKMFLMTGSGIITEDEALAQGFRGLLHKPFSFSGLLRMLLAAGVTKRHREIREAVAA